jgi:glycosyltransferase involved in cell wall biosynthesis
MNTFDALLYVFIFIASIQFIYYIFIFSRFAFAKINQPSLKNISISVIVCAKNEAKNLSTLIPKLLEQDYPSFEIVLINDASSDNTLEIMESFELKYSNIKVVNVINNEAFWGNKKYALTLGIKASSYDFLLFTDADCNPKSNQWIKTMSSHFTNKKSIIIGYGAYAKKKNSLLNKLIRYETLFTALQYFSYTKIGIPYMGVGRNLAYKKDTFYKANGFMSHMNIRSGDDDLFVNQVATNENTSICFSQNSFTISKPKKTFSQWFKQKRRHISTAKYYKLQHKFLLGLFYLSQILFWILSISLLIISYKPIIVISLISLKLMVQYIIIGKTAKKLDETDTIIWSPFLEIFLVIFQLSIFISNLISKPKHWK